MKLRFCDLQLSGTLNTERFFISESLLTPKYFETLYLGSLNIV